MALGSVCHNRQELGFDLVYFSFVTLTTMGYGDILPATRISRMLAATEAVIGQIYLAVLVARLVSLYAMRPTKQALEIERLELRELDVNLAVKTND
jgi:Na+/H+-dicarboxylate symporter